MFPLQSVLFPRAALPLQVFEPRYLRMIDEVLDGDRRFGVVLIARGNEVGGGDERERVGTVARIVRVGALDDGRLTLVALGERRLRVVDWLEDDPYPVATITELEPDGTGPGTEAMVDRARRAYRRTLAIASELGGTTADPEPESEAQPEDADTEGGVEDAPSGEAPVGDVPPDAAPADDEPVKEPPAAAGEEAPASEPVGEAATGDASDEAKGS